MEKGFKKLAGMRVMLSLPYKPVSDIKLSPVQQQEVDREFAEKCEKLEIYAVGDTVEGYKEGDIVNVPTDVLRRARFVNVNDEQKLIINSMDIDILW